MDPRIMHENIVGERAQEREQGPSEIAAAKQAERFAMQQERVVVVLLTIERLIAAANGGVRIDNAARGCERVSQGHLCNGLGEYRRGRYDINVAAVTFLVIYVREEVAFHIGDHSQVRRAVEPL